MKKPTRRMNLTTETLRTLTNGQLDQVAGGTLNGGGTQFCPVPPIHDPSERVCFVTRP